MNEQDCKVHLCTSEKTELINEKLSKIKHVATMGKAYVKQSPMNVFAAMATATVTGFLFLPAATSNLYPAEAAPLSPALSSLDGPLKNYVVSRKTPKSVEEVVGALKRDFKKNNFIVKGVIDHQSIAKSQGLEIPENTALLVGLPSFEAPIIKANPVGSLFVPLTVAVWRENKITYIAYWNPSTDFKNNLGSLSKDADEVIRAMTMDLQKIVQNAL